MNKKGFAISVILYSIIFLVITIIFILLGIAKTRYTVNEKLRESITSDLNDLEEELHGTSSANCTISGRYSGDDYVLTMTVKDKNGNTYNWNNNSWGGISYSWDGIMYTATNDSNTKTISHSGTYIGYFKDTIGNIGSCEKNVRAKTGYRYRDCKNSNIQYGSWYNSNGVDTYSQTCEEITLETAESSNSNFYRTCSIADESLCGGASCKHVIEYRRDATGCNWTDEEYSSWSTSYVSSTTLRDVETRTAFD